MVSGVPDFLPALSRGSRCHPNRRRTLHTLAGGAESDGRTDGLIGLVGADERPARGNGCPRGLVSTALGASDSAANAARIGTEFLVDAFPGIGALRRFRKRLRAVRSTRGSRRRMDGVARLGSRHPRHHAAERASGRVPLDASLVNADADAGYRHGELSTRTSAAPMSGAFGVAQRSSRPLNAEERLVGR